MNYYLYKLLYFDYERNRFKDNAPQEYWDEVLGAELENDEEL